MVILRLRSNRSLITLLGPASGGGDEAELPAAAILLYVGSSNRDDSADGREINEM